MHLPQSDGKFRLQSPDSVPVMMGAADLALIQQMAADLPDQARLLEIGPWLGGVSQHLADHGTLHVVDHFRWSAQNAQKHPDLLPVGASFRPLFERHLQTQGKAARLSECDISAFEWSGGALDFCLIDAPRNREDLWLCLRQVLSALTETGVVLIKHGLNPAHLDMMALIEVLITHQVLELVLTGQPGWCNIAVLRRGEAGTELPTKAELALWLKTPCNIKRLPKDGPPERAFLMMAHLAELAAVGEPTAAFAALRQQRPDAALLAAWILLEPDIALNTAETGAFAAFADLVEYHHSADQKINWAPPDHSLAWALRHCWCAYVANQNGQAFALFEIVAAFEAGRIRDLLPKETAK